MKTVLALTAHTGIWVSMYKSGKGCVGREKENLFFTFVAQEPQSQEYLLLSDYRQDSFVHISSQS